MFEKLRAERKEQKKTCQQMAGVIGLQTHAAYLRKESGDIPFTLDEAKAVADNLGKHMEDLFFDGEVS